MVDVEMRAQHRVDRLAREAGGFEIGEDGNWRLSRWGCGAGLVVAEAGVDDNALPARATARRLDDSAWMLILSRPRSSAKCGCSQEIGKISS